MPKETIHFSDVHAARSIFGNDEDNLDVMAQALHVKLVSRGSFIKIMGDAARIDRAKLFMDDLIRLQKTGKKIDRADILYSLSNIGGAGGLSPNQKGSSRIVRVSPRKNLVYPKSKNQADYIDAISQYDVVLSVGPAGTGKTYLAMAMAVSWLLEGRVKRIILTRPAVEAGESLGFLPGDLYQKLNPYLRPLYDALYEMVEVDKIQRLMESGVIEIAPLAYMRGRTLNDSFIVLDEAQNCTIEQMKMFLTRLGFDSKMVITGDTTQVDLPGHKLSGLIHARSILSGIRGIKILSFSEKDVVRHPLVKKIIHSYEEHGSGMMKPDSHASKSQRKKKERQTPREEDISAT